MLFGSMPWTQNWKTAAMKREGWRKKIGEAMA
jgi:hypothetical protein